MNQVARDRLLQAAMLSLLCISLHAQTGTVRDRSDLHFGMLDWTVSPKTAPAAEKTGTVLPGGNETFPLLAGGSGYAPGTARTALYPRETRLGILDYGDTDRQLVSFLESVSRGLSGSRLDPSLCDPSRPFLSVLADFQMAKLPPVRGVLFSRPRAVTQTGTSILFRLQCGKDGVSAPVYLTMAVDQLATGRKITEIVFDGETYAGLAQPY